MHPLLPLIVSGCVWAVVLVGSLYLSGFVYDDHRRSLPYDDTGFRYSFDWSHSHDGLIATYTNAGLAGVQAIFLFLFAMAQGSRDRITVLRRMFFVSTISTIVFLVQMLVTRFPDPNTDLANKRHWTYTQQPAQYIFGGLFVQFYTKHNVIRAVSWFYVAGAVFVLVPTHYFYLVDVMTGIITGLTVFLVYHWQVRTTMTIARHWWTMVYEADMTRWHTDDRGSTLLLGPRKVAAIREEDVLERERVGSMNSTQFVEGLAIGQLAPAPRDPEEAAKALVKASLVNGDSVHTPTSGGGRPPQYPVPAGGGRAHHHNSSFSPSEREGLLNSPAERPRTLVPGNFDAAAYTQQASSPSSGGGGGSVGGQYYLQYNPSITNSSLPRGGRGGSALSAQANSDTNTSTIHVMAATGDADQLNNPTSAQYLPASLRFSFNPADAHRDYRTEFFQAPELTMLSRAQCLAAILDRVEAEHYLPTSIHTADRNAHGYQQPRTTTATAAPADMSRKESESGAGAERRSRDGGRGPFPPRRQASRMVDHSGSGGEENNTSLPQIANTSLTTPSTTAGGGSALETNGVSLASTNISKTPDHTVEYHPGAIRSGGAPDKKRSVSRGSILSIDGTATTTTGAAASSPQRNGSYGSEAVRNNGADRTQQEADAEDPETAQKRKQLWRKRWLIILGALVLSLGWGGGCAMANLISINVADHNRPIGSPLPHDIVYKYLPRVPDHTPDYILYTQIVLVLIYTMLCRNRFVILRRTVFWYGICMAGRCLTVPATFLPDPSPICAHREHPPGTTCGDLIYSGHTISFIATLSIVLKYVGPLWVRLGTLAFTILGLLSVICSRLHYTRDVVTAILVCVAVFHLSHRLLFHRIDLFLRFKVLRYFELDYFCMLVEDRRLARRGQVRPHLFLRGAVGETFAQIAEVWRFSHRHDKSKREPSSASSEVPAVTAQ